MKLRGSSVGLVVTTLMVVTFMTIFLSAYILCIAKLNYAQDVNDNVQQLIEVATKEGLLNTDLRTKFGDMDVKKSDGNTAKLYTFYYQTYDVTGTNIVFNTKQQITDSQISSGVNFANLRGTHRGIFLTIKADRKSGNNFKSGNKVIPDMSSLTNFNLSVTKTRAVQLY